MPLLSLISDKKPTKKYISFIISDNRIPVKGYVVQKTWSMFSIITSATNKVLVSIKRLCDIIIVDQRTYKYTVYYRPLQIRIHCNLSGRLLVRETCILVQVGGPRKRFLTINSGKASDFCRIIIMLITQSLSKI